MLGKSVPRTIRSAAAASLGTRLTGNGAIRFMKSVHAIVVSR
jgi:hypothetical protein